MERLDIHVALEVCEIVIESATLVPIVFALSGLPIYVAQFPLAPLTRMHPAFSPCRAARPSHRVPAFRFIAFYWGQLKNSRTFLNTSSSFAVFTFPIELRIRWCSSEKALRTNKARLTEFAAFTIAGIQRNGESIVVSAARDLAENQIRAWKILNHQSRSALSAGSRKGNDNDFAGYRFDHAASSSGEFQSRARTDSLSSAPLNRVFCSHSFERSVSNG